MVLKKRIMAGCLAITMCISALPVQAEVQERAEMSVPVTVYTEEENPVSENEYAEAETLLSEQGDTEEEKMVSEHTDTEEGTSISESEAVDKEVQHESDSEQLLQVDEILSDACLDLPDSDELFAGYVEEQFYGDYGIAAYKLLRGDTLEGANKRFYDQLSVNIKEVAAGNMSTTLWSFAAEDLLEQSYFPAEELGVETITSSNIRDLADREMKKQYNSALIMRSLVVDHPYELFWFNKGTGGMHVTYTLGYTSKRITIKSFKISFAVVEDYGTEEEYTVNAEKLQSVAKAVENANSIVEDCEALSDLQKICRYREVLRNLSDYNHSAINPESQKRYGDPWQMIWLFDGDPETKVVCEGFSKGFQYLMDRSSFSSYEIYSNIAAGTFNGAAHMWNTVHMDDGNNYLADVTNATSFEEGTVLRKFLQPVDSGNYLEGYRFDAEQVQTEKERYYVFGASYVYDQTTLSLYSEEELTLSEYPYEVPGEIVTVRGYYGDLIYQITGNRQTGYSMTLSGAGNLELMEYGRYPWYKYSQAITQVLVEDGVTGICEQAFSGWESLETVVLPESVRTIGAYAFANCGALESIVVPGLAEVGKAAFLNCDALQEAEFSGSQEQWNRICSLTDNSSLANANVHYVFKILTQPEDITAALGKLVSFHVDAPNAASFRWQYSKNGTSWYNSSCSGSDQDTLKMTVSTGNAGNLYRCRLTDSTGKVVYTETVQILIPKKAVITEQPAFVTAQIGQRVAFSVKADHVIAYQWQYSKDGKNWYNSSCTGCDTAKMHITVSKSNYRNRYRCVVTGDDGQKVLSEPADLVCFMQIPEDSYAVLGEKASYSVEVADAASYCWQYSRDGGKTWYNSSLSTAKTGTISLTVSNSNANHLYRCIIISAYGHELVTDPVGRVYVR